jgi:hypothetical protein
MTQMVEESQTPSSTFQHSKRMKRTNEKDVNPSMEKKKFNAPWLKRQGYLTKCYSN